MPAQPGGPRAPMPVQTNPSVHRLPPPDQRGYTPYLRQAPPARAGSQGPQAPRNGSADARAWRPYGPGNMPVQR